MNNVLQALIHFFKNVGTGQYMKLDKKGLIAELDQFGVSLADLEVTLANMMNWMATQQSGSKTLPPSPPQYLTNYATQFHTGMRVFSPVECAKLSKLSRGFLICLEQQGALTPEVREVVIDHLMIIATSENRVIRLPQTKWIAFQILFSDASPTDVAYVEWILFGKVVEVH